MFSKKQQQKQPPEPRPPSQLDSQGDVMLDSLGRVMSRVEVEERRKRVGLCPQCGRVETHKVMLRGAIRKPQVCMSNVFCFCWVRTRINYIVNVSSLFESNF